MTLIKSAIIFVKMKKVKYILAKLTLGLIATHIVFTISDENSDFKLIMEADDQPLLELFSTPIPNIPISTHPPN